MNVKKVPLRAGEKKILHFVVVSLTIIASEWYKAIGQTDLDTLE